MGFQVPDYVPDTTLRPPPCEVIRQPGVDSIKIAHGDYELGFAGFIKAAFPMERVVSARLEPDGMATVILRNDRPALAQKKAAA